MEEVAGGASPLGDPSKSIRHLLTNNMSYKKKKTKKNSVNQLMRKLRLIKIVLLKKYKSFKTKKEDQMVQRQTTTIMQWLRGRSKSIRQNSLKINDWVDEYINTCVLNGKPVDVLTQFCLAKDLELRYQKQGNNFIPTKGETTLFLEDIPEVVDTFKSNGIGINWTITLNRSYLDGGRISSSIENEYRDMINGLIEQSSMSDVLLLNWEDEILNGRPEASTKVQNNIFDFVAAGAFKIDLDRHMSWVKNDTDIIQSDTEIEDDLKFKIACEAEEGRFLLSSQSPFPNGQFILVPLELPERYVFFEILAPDFQKRIVPILRPYPWRLE